METFKSTEVIVKKTAKNFFNTFGNLNNLKEIMPSEIEGFESTEMTCTLKMQGLPKLTLEISEKIEFSKISLSSKESKLPLTLDCFIVEKGAFCIVRIEINIEVNIMMKMMIKKPINQFLDILASKIQEY